MQDDSITERLGPGSPTWRDHSAFHVARYLFAAEHVQGRRVLDAGTGTGYGALILKASGAAEVQAIDIDPASVEQARARFQADGLEYLVDDCEALANVRGPFDVICNFENIEHLNRPDAFLASAARALKEDGVLFCSTPDRAASDWEGDRPANPYHTTEWFRDEFRDLLARHFEEVEIRVQVEHLSVLLRREGRDHLGRHLAYLWGSPLVRLSRLLGRLMGQEPPSWQPLGYLASASPSDYPIVRAPVAELLGQPTFHFAIARRPRRDAEARPPAPA